VVVVVSDETQYPDCVFQKGVRLVLLSIFAFPGMVKVPPSAGPLVTHTPG
jgi:hypothetical protein